MTLKIREDFRALIPPLRPWERTELRANIYDCAGCLSPIIVWADHGIVVDGHNRLEICEELGLKYTVDELVFEDEADVKRWILQNQLGRRNLNAEQVAYFRGLLYNEEKNEHGGDRKSDQDATVASCSTAERIAQQSGVSARTVHNDAQFADAVDRLGLQEEVVSGNAKGKRKEIVAKARALDATESSKPASPKLEAWEDALRKIENLILSVPKDDRDKLLDGLLLFLRETS
jgi:hypothetical protein